MTMVTAARRAPVEVFAEIVCPFTHVGLHRFVAERARSSASRAIVVRAWPLEWINGAPLASEHVAAEVEALQATIAPQLFRGFDTAKFPTTSIPAFGLAAAAYARDLATGEAVSLALRDAVFEQGLDISDLAVLRALGARYGVTPFGAADAAAAARADWERGATRGVRGSPHFFTEEADWFCPGLDIERIDDRFVVAAAAGARAFYDTALR